MTKEQLEKMSTITRSAENYVSDKNRIYEKIGNYENISLTETPNLIKDILDYAKNNNLNRRQLFVILQDIVVEMQSSRSHSEIAYDMLTNFLDNLQGLVASSSIIKLSNDQTDNAGLVEYVRGLKWINE